MEEIGIRRLRTNDEFLECVRLQKLIWGEDFSERVPLAILKVGQRIGGVTAGAFDRRARMLGFVFGLTGVERGRLVHWSDMLAVVPEARNLGLGRRLKEFQRDELRRIGVELVYWTYDPLVARNAHLNLVRLGAAVIEYVVDMYGPDTDSELHRGLGTDRFVIGWDIARQATATAPVSAARAVALVHGRDRDGPELRSDVLAARPERVTIEIPGDIAAVQRGSGELASLWRSVTRAGFIAALGKGYRVAGFAGPGEGGAARYILDRRGR
jgi:predicted GNAT superfamily acetyltransferase